MLNRPKTRSKWVSWLSRVLSTPEPAPIPGPDTSVRTHVILLDGTLSSLKPSQETSIGLIFRLLALQSPDVIVHYTSGLQWGDWRSNIRVMTGAGLGHQIRTAYGALASRYKPGDRIFIFGFSRGAFAARSLCGMIDQVGLVTAEHATARNIALAWRQYRNQTRFKRFGETLCHPQVNIDFLGVFDTVSALGLRLPVVWRWMPDLYSFHNHHVCDAVRANYHALALTENRLAYSPECWDLDQIPDNTVVQQVWFRGVHGDIGGHIGRFQSSRPLANIPLVWMLERAADRGLTLSADWRQGFPTNAQAPSLGTWRGFGAFLIFRAKRRVAKSDHEWIHHTAIEQD